MILIEGLSKSYGTKDVLDRLDLSVDAGEIRAIVGLSGADKSTLAQCVTLLERPTSGSVFVNGVDLTLWAPRTCVKHGDGSAPSSSATACSRGALQPRMSRCRWRISA